MERMSAFILVLSYPSNQILRIIFDQISALHKSVRGSSPDGALYWLCRMLDGGANPRYLARRIVRMAWEDS